MRKRYMTDEKLQKIETFKRMWEAGASYRAISEATGISISALGSSRERWGMAPRLRVTNEKNAAAKVITENRKIARVSGTLEPLPSLAGLVFASNAEPTDVKIVSHKFLPGHKCAWPIDVEGVKHASCGAHCDTPGPYCDEHRKLAYVPPDELAEAIAKVTWFNQRRSRWN